MFKHVCGLLLAVCFVTCVAWAAEDPMLGDWKLNSQKSQMFDEMKVTNIGANKYSFDFGAPNPEEIVVDGTDQPGIFGTTLAVTAMSPREWMVVRKKDGHVLLKAIWALSKDNKTLQDNYSELGADGKVTTHVVYQYDRKGGGADFAADWVSTREQFDVVHTLKVSPYEGDGLSFISSLGNITRNMRFDGKDYPTSRPQIVTSAQRVNERTIELTDKRDGKIADRQEIIVSEDGKTLTMTIHRTGRSEPDVRVYEKE